MYLSLSQRAFFARPVDGTSGPTQISARADVSFPEPRFCVWRGDGKEILFADSSGQIWTVAVDTARHQFQEPARLFKLPGFWPPSVTESTMLATSRDGSRILAVVGKELPPSSFINLMADWTAASGLGAVTGGASATGLVGIPLLMLAMLRLIVATIRTRRQQRNN